MCSSWLDMDPVSAGILLQLAASCTHSYSVTTASGGAEALKLLKTQQFDVVVTDVVTLIKGPLLGVKQTKLVRKQTSSF